MAAILPELAGLTVSEAVAFAIGAAVHDPLRPLTQDLANKSWSLHTSKPLDPAALAEIVAESVEALGWGRDEAAKTGISADNFDALFHATETAPGFGTLLQMLRRGTITADGFTHGLRKAKLEGRWDDAISDLRHEKLSQNEIAAAVHRGLIPDPGLLLGEQPSGPRKVDSYPVYKIPALEEAAAHGIDRDRLGVLIGLQGLPMGVIEAAHAYFRGIITHGDYIAAFNESNNRNEWAEAVLDYARQIPTARDFLENALRGHHPLSWAQDQVKRHGMSADDALILWQNQGRPLNLHQITQGLAWGGKYQPAAGDDPDPWMQAVLLGAVRPEYYDLQHSLKYNLPSAFYFRSLQEKGVLKTAEAETWYKRLGWPPDLAKQVADAFGTSTSTTVDPHVTKAQTQLWTTQHTSYKNAESDDTDAKETFALLDIPAAAQTEILKYWNRERELVRKQLTPAQLKKAFKNGATNPATGAVWTQDEILAELIGRGYSPNDAATFIGL